MSQFVAFLMAVVWGVSAVAFGLIPVWTSLLLTRINQDFAFSEDAMLREGSIIIFAITLTISVLVDCYVSGYRYRNRFIALLFNAFLPLSICVFGMTIHISTIFTNPEALKISFVLFIDISIAVCAVLFCVIQKVIMVYKTDQGAA
jgi:hypothetical protein